jgi:hypothetical protein
MYSQISDSKELSKKYILTLINIAASDGYHTKELQYIETQASLLNISQLTVKEYIDNPISIERLELPTLSHDLKILLVRDVYTIVAMDGKLSKEEEKLTERLHQLLQLSPLEIASVKDWLDRYWSVLKRGLTAPFPYKNTSKDFEINPGIDSKNSVHRGVKIQKSLSKEDYLKSLAALKGRDSFGVAGEFLGTTAGAAAGFASAGVSASLAGASTILGSSTLGTLLGGIFVTATPIGWVVGCAAAAGALGYGITKLCTSGGENDIKRTILKSDINEKLNEELSAANEHYQDSVSQFINQLMFTVKSDKITTENAQRLQHLVLTGVMPVETANIRLNALI